MLHQTRRRAKTNIIKVVLIIFSQKQTKITHGYYKYTALRINWKKFQNSVLGFSKRQTICRPQVIHMLVGDDMSQSPHIDGLNPCLSLNQLKSTSGLFHLYYKLSFVKKSLNNYLGLINHACLNNLPTARGIKWRWSYTRSWRLLCLFFCQQNIL